MSENNFDTLLEQGRQLRIQLKSEQKCLVEARQTKPGPEFGTRVRDRVREQGCLSRISALNAQRDVVIEQLRTVVRASTPAEQHGQKRKLADILHASA